MDDAFHTLPLDSLTADWRLGLGEMPTRRAVASRWESTEEGQSAGPSQIVGFSYPGEAGKPMEIGSRTVGVSCDDRTPVSGPTAWGDE
jgi:hypothetical protein